MNEIFFFVFIGEFLLVHIQSSHTITVKELLYKTSGIAQILVLIIVAWSADAEIIINSTLTTQQLNPVMVPSKYRQFTIMVDRHLQTAPGMSEALYKSMTGHTPRIIYIFCAQTCGVCLDFDYFQIPFGICRTERRSYYYMQPKCIC